MYWIPTLIFLGISAICCSIGFKKFVYFLSIGYGFSVVGLGISYLVYGFIHDTKDIITLLWVILFIIYGVRLSGFLIARELKNPTYRKVLKEATKEDVKKMPFLVKVTIWISVTILYFLQTCPVFYRLANAIGNEDVLLRFSNFTTVDWTSLIAPLIGLALTICGLLLETIADKQKSAQKKINPSMVATKGLFKMCRCPNYFGEIVFWTGVFVGGLQSYNHYGQWICAILGYICIFYVMINSTKRIDKRQENRYGENEEYRKYADHTPILIPLIPIYHIGSKKDKKAHKTKEL